MRIALFGGSFNPPHVAHQMVALHVLETAPVDELWLLPCFKHPFEKALVPFEDRFRMCELAAAGLGARVRVSDIERTLGGESLTVRTVRKLHADRPGDAFSLVIGSDLVPESERWFGADELRRSIPFIVVGRSGIDAPPRVAMPAVSSTEIRESLRAGKPVEDLVPRAVLDYIYERGLFEARRPT